MADWIKAVRLADDHGGRGILSVRGPVQAEVLMSSDRWPGVEGQKMSEARRLNLFAITGLVADEVARNAFVAAAREGGLRIIES
ncbi:DUF982 domain-containing protein [Frigidibacter mobilis]|uniref:DUF982 domain-containing protein n=1 Tax=Frigidibacter mobilis TaxID=1335048 RepID=A0A159Z5I7_9RHOB|nr:DUF982 domain-containing protein [Frigidibacter mobilis]AMY69668.1 hypothetical protein AKL17_2422 [Frigidibacter mobilis]